MEIHNFALPLEVKTKSTDVFKCIIGLELVNIHQAFFIVCQNVAILYIISRQIAISTNIENAERVSPLFKRIKINDAEHKKLYKYVPPQHYLWLCSKNIKDACSSNYMHVKTRSDAHTPEAPEEQ